jgi:hypothetical protein
MHATTAVDRINLHVTEVRKDTGDIGGRFIEQHGATVKTPGQLARYFKRGKLHEFRKAGTRAARTKICFLKWKQFLLGRTSAVGSGQVRGEVRLADVPQASQF